MNTVYNTCRKVLWLSIVVSITVLAGIPTLKAEDVSDGIRIDDLQPWRGYFAGQEAVFRFSVTARRPVEGRMVWRFAVMQATAARGEQALAIDAVRPATIEIPLQLPEPKPGVIIDALLEIGVVKDGHSEALLTHRKAVRLYPENPFFEQTAWLEPQRIHLFDPENSLTERFRELDVPFEGLHNPRALQTLNNGILIAGADISFRDYRGLFPEMLAAASRGVKVLCLTPAGGEIELPGMGDSELPRPRSVRFHGAEEIIHSYDKKFDAVSWPPDGRIASAGITLEGVRGSVVGQVGNHADAWPWIEFEYASGGRLILCGFAIAEQWDAGPMPRFLLFEIINEFRHRSQSRRTSSRPAN